MTSEGRTTSCRYCGEEIIHNDEGGFWQHASDQAVVCAIGLDTDAPGEIAVQYARPSGEWRCIIDGRTEPCGECSGCREVQDENAASGRGPSPEDEPLWGWKDGRPTFDGADLCPCSTPGWSHTAAAHDQSGRTHACERDGEDCSPDTCGKVPRAPQSGRVESARQHAERTRHSVKEALNEPWECLDCPAQAGLCDYGKGDPR